MLETTGDYQLDYLRDEDELEEVFRLRYRVFNLEMQEGLDSAHEWEMDFDEFDPCCHHVIVRHRPSDAIVGTYRLLTRLTAEGRPHYAASEFDLSTLPDSLLDDAVEVGRACIDPLHRNGRVLIMLWRGVTQYLGYNEMRFLFGCCSINSQSHAEAWAVLEWLQQRNFVHPDLKVFPHPSYACDRKVAPLPQHKIKIPMLMKLYLENDLRVLGEPAIDRAFKTVDYFVLFDAKQISEKTRKLLFAKPK